MKESRKEIKRDDMEASVRVTQKRTVWTDEGGNRAECAANGDLYINGATAESVLSEEGAESLKVKGAKKWLKSNGYTKQKTHWQVIAVAELDVAADIHEVVASLKNALSEAATESASE